MSIVEHWLVIIDILTLLAEKHLLRIYVDILYGIDFT